MNSNNSGIGFLGILTIVFIVLKLTGNIAWSWWLVLLPLYISVVILIALILIIAILKSFSNKK